MKLVHLVGFIIKKFVMMHGYMNVKKKNTVFNLCQIFKRFISHHYVVIFDIHSVDEMNTV